MDSLYYELPIGLSSNGEMLKNVELLITALTHSSYSNELMVLQKKYLSQRLLRNRTHGRETCFP